MIILCVICRDPLIQYDDPKEDKIYFTDCGHAFHFQCIDQWLNRSQTCPHCRETLTRKKIHRVYFTFNDETSSNIPESLLLREKIANLEFQNLLKDKNIKNFVSKTADLKKQNAELRQEVRNVESKINKKNNIIYELNEKIKHLNECSSQYEVLKEEFSKTKKQLDGLERTIIQKQNKITTLETHLKYQLKVCEREKKNLLNNKLEQCITSDYKNKNSEENCTIKSCYRNSNNDSLVTSRKGIIYNQTDTRQKTKNQNDSPSPPWISTGMDEEEYTLDTTFDECPSSTKKARLFLHQSGNNSCEIRTITYDDYDVRNVSSTNKQSKKRKILKVKSVL